MERSGRPLSVNVGTYEARIDDKARIILPGAFRQALRRSFIISAWFNQCLSLWNPADWHTFVEREVDRLSDLSEKARQMSRWLHSSAHNVETDTQARFVVPPPLRTFAAIEKDIVIIGARNRVEVWSRPRWQEYLAKASSSIEEIAESLSRDLKI